MAEPSSVDKPETKKDEDARQLAQYALTTGMFEQLVYCDDCKDVVAIKLPGKRPFACVFKGWFVDMTTKSDYCRACMVKWLEDEGIPPQESPLAFNPRVAFIHDLDTPRDLCVFCEEMDNLQRCSKCCDRLVARQALGSEEYDELMPYYFDDRKGRITEGSHATQAKAALIEEALAVGQADAVVSLLEAGPRSPPKEKPANGEDLPLCKDCWYVYQSLSDESSSSEPGLTGHGILPRLGLVEENKMGAEGW